jgi:hypothetical protein
VGARDGLLEMEVDRVQGTAQAWTVVELTGLTLISTGTVLVIAGVLRERLRSTGNTAAR